MYSTIDIVAAAFMAYEKNGRKIEKTDYAGSVGDDIVLAYPATVSNKTIVINAVNNNSITDEAREFAKNAIQEMQSNNTMALLTGAQPSEFEVKLLETFEHDEQAYNKIGLMVYAPSVYSRMKIREAVAEKIAGAMYTSVALGNPGDEIVVDFEHVESHYLTQFKCYSVFGNDDKGNLVSFVTRHGHLANSIKLVGKIKKTGPDSHRKNAVVTVLNNVKQHLDKPITVS